ncbi:protein MEI2-like 4 [Wolffia australiana]
MASEIMNQRYLSSVCMASAPSSFFSNSLRLLNERQADFWKPESLPYGRGREETLESMDEIEARVIRDILPDDDELISGVTDGIEYNNLHHNLDEAEDDLFCSIGGMELEADEGRRGNKYLDQHPSRTLFVGNIDASVEEFELRALFEQYGSIRALNMASRHRGFVTITFYDLRSARSAMKALQSKSLRNRVVDVQFSFPKDNLLEGDINEGVIEIFHLESYVFNEDLIKIFAEYGDVKEIHEIPHKRHHKLVEFYDVRAAHAVLYGSNGADDFLGSKIKILSKKTGPARWGAIQQPSPRESARCSRLEPPTDLGSSPLPCSISPHSSRAMSSYLQSPHRQLDSCQFPHSLSSPALVSPSGFAELEVNHNGLSNGLGSPYSRSLPDYHDRLTGGLPVNPLSPFPCSSMNPKQVQDYDHGFGGSGNQSPWSVSPGPMAWPNSPSTVNFTASPSQAHGPLISSPYMPPAHHYSVGSAPSGNSLVSSLWDRRASGPQFQTALNPLELSAQGFGPARSPQPRAQTIHNRNPMIPPLSPFDSPKDRARTRRSESSANQPDNKKQFELDIDRIIRGDDSRTTLMIKNIPNKYTSKMLLAAIDDSHHGTYDFIYLPIDFKNKCNVGYAFINMVDPGKIIPFFQTFNGKKWEKFNSEKVASLAYARIQGKAALIAHFQNSSLMNEDKRCRPILFQTEGPNAGDQEPFPVGGHVRSRHGKSRTNSHDSTPRPSSHSSHVPVNGDDSPNGSDSFSPGSSLKPSDSS